jgi:hypothetical protein
MVDAPESTQQQLETLRHVLQENNERIDCIVQEKQRTEQSLATCQAELLQCREQLHQRESEITQLRCALTAHLDGSTQMLLHSLRQKLAAEVQGREAAQATTLSLRADLLQAQKFYNEECKRARELDSELQQAKQQNNEEGKCTRLLHKQLRDLQKSTAKEREHLRTQLQSAHTSCAILKQRILGSAQHSEAGAVDTSSGEQTLWPARQIGLLQPEFSAQMADLQTRLWEMQAELTAKTTQVAKLTRTCALHAVHHQRYEETRLHLERAVRNNHVLTMREEKCGVIVRSALNVLKAQYPGEFGMCAVIAKNKYPQANELALLYATLAVYAFRERVPPSSAPAASTQQR